MPIKKLAICSLAVLLLLNDAASGRGTKGVLSCSGVWEMGGVERGDIKQKTFYLKNSGQKKAEIRKINSCCGYTARMRDWNIQPGEQAPVKVTLEASRKREGEDLKALRIEYFDGNDRVLTVRLRTRILPRKLGRSDVEGISVHDLNDMLMDGGSVAVLDVRERPEFSAKHIPGAVNLPRSKFNRDPALLLDLAGGIGTESAIAVNCGGGIRSAYVAAKLAESGYKAYNVSGGIKAWQEAGYGLVLGPGIDLDLEPLTIRVEEAYEQYFLGFGERIFWIDVRAAEDYSAGHIPGALNIPVDSFVDRIAEIPTDIEIVLYCDDKSCDQSTAAAEILISRGYMHPKIKVFEDGWLGWKENGLPAEQSNP